MLRQLCLSSVNRLSSLARPVIANIMTNGGIAAMRSSGETALITDLHFSYGERLTMAAANQTSFGFS